MSELEDFNDPFNGGSSEEYQPSTSDSEQSENRGENNENEDSREHRGIDNKRKRKVRNEAHWKRNVKKRLLASGIEHSNSKNRLRAARKIGPDCGCKKQCYLKIEHNERESILKQFNDIANKIEQDRYLIGNIEASVPVRSRPVNGRGRPRQASYKYKIRLGKKSVKVCKKAFCNIHGISRKRVELLAKHIHSFGEISSPKERRGKHHNRPNAIPDDIVKQVDQHIRSFPKRSSHYGRKRNYNTHYLSSELNVKRMYELYLERFEPEMKVLLDNRKEKSAHFKPKVTYDFYFRYFKANFKYKFGHPRSDTCQLCDRLDTEFKSENLTEERRVELEAERALHHSKSKAFFDDLAQKTKIAKEYKNVETLSFDYQQNLPLPKVPSGDAFYLRQLWMFNFCIHSAKNNIAHFYVYDETEGKKTPNEPISFLQHYFEHVLSKEVDTLYLFSDNCCAQNKNSTMMQFLYYLVQSGRFKRIIHRFPEPGHSFLPCDRCFGQVEKHLRKIERIFVPEEYMRAMKQCSRQFEIVKMNRQQIFNYVEILKPHFKKIITNKNRERFLIMQYRMFVYDQDHRNEIRCCKTVTFPNPTLTSFSIQKSSALPNIAAVHVAYPVPLAIKKAKYDNVMRLAIQYVPRNDIWFYENLKSDEQQRNGGNDTDVTDDDANE